jgi:hypothetical protein
MAVLGRQLSSQLDDLSLHLRMLAPLAHAFEVRLDLAIKLEALASGADHKGVLYDIATKLWLRVNGQSALMQ